MQIAKYGVSLSIFFILIILETFFPLFTDWKNRWKHAARNIFIIFFNSVLLIVLFSKLVGIVFEHSANIKFGLFYRIDAPAWLKIAVVFLLFDLWMYIWHRMNHEIDFLWRFHRMHHSDPNMDVTTALRFHFGELIFSTILRFGIILLLGLSPFILVLYETIMLPVIFFHHSNFYLPEKIDRVLRKVIITPWMHWVHHSDIREEMDSNYGTIFSWWDRLARSFKLRSDPKKIHYGVPEMEDSRWQTIGGMLKTPFVSTE
ncbi:MAG: sterol desaturase family protein [Calditrichaeota bacterium]|nr:sterol desaturase family protein [Calditrichota bacterium]